MLSAVTLGAIIAIFMGKDGMNRDDGFIDNIDNVAENYFSYSVQGVILFDNYVINRAGGVEANWDVVGLRRYITPSVDGNRFKLSLTIVSSFFFKKKPKGMYTITFHYILYG
jgi:hypothetical protein